MNNHTQCTLVRNQIHQTAWIPSIFAKLNSYVKLRKAGEWIDGWKVVSVGTKLPSNFVNERTQDYKNMKKMTDI